MKIPQDRSENQEDVHDRSISAKMAATVSKSAQIIPHSPCVYPPQFCTLQVRRAWSVDRILGCGARSKTLLSQSRSSSLLSPPSFLVQLPVLQLPRLPLLPTSFHNVYTSLSSSSLEARKEEGGTGLERGLNRESRRTIEFPKTDGTWREWLRWINRSRGGCLIFYEV